jgi:NTE family protein
MKKKVALVLSTGGARGIAHIGVIEELIKQDYNISSIAGCSMGALVGAAFASDSLDQCKKVMCDLNRRNFFNYVDFTLNRKGLIKGNRIRKELEKLFGDKNIEDLSMPFTAIATDILNEKEVIFESGNIVDAIRASISLPFIFEPFKKDDKLLLDGGLINPLPLNQVKRHPEDILIGVSVGEKGEQMRKINQFTLMIEAVTILIQKNVKNSIDAFKPDIMIQVPVRNYSILDFRKSSLLIEEGINAAKKSLLEYEARNIR